MIPDFRKIAAKALFEFGDCHVIDWQIDISRDLSILQIYI